MIKRTNNQKQKHQENMKNILIKNPNTRVPAQPAGGTVTNQRDNGIQKVKNILKCHYCDKFGHINKYCRKKTKEKKLSNNKKKVNKRYAIIKK